MRRTIGTVVAVVYDYKTTLLLSTQVIEHLMKQFTCTSAIMDTLGKRNLFLLLESIYMEPSKK